jgi:hypothetical protein
LIPNTQFVGQTMPTPELANETPKFIPFGNESYYATRSSNKWLRFGHPKAADD